MVLIFLFLNNIKFFNLFNKIYSFILKIGIKKNDFVDKNNKLVSLAGNYYVQFYEWGSKWRVHDDSEDSDRSLYFLF